MSTQKLGLGCFGYGCIIAIAIFTLVIGGTAWWVTSSIRKGVHEYTVESASPISVTDVDPAVAVIAKNKMNALLQALDSGGPIAVTFSGAEVRAIIQSSAWRDKLDCEFKDEQVQLRFSFPLSMLGEWGAAQVLVGGLSRRWIAGRAAGTISFRDGELHISLSELILGSKEMGDIARGHAVEWIVGAIQSVLAAESSTDDAESEKKLITRTPLSSLKSLQVKDGALAIELLSKS